MVNQQNDNWMDTGKSLSQIQAENAYWEWICETFTDQVGSVKIHDLNYCQTGLRNGASIATAIYAYKRIGFNDQQIADEVEMVMQTYSATAWVPEGIGGKYKRQYQPSFFGGVNTYPVNWAEPQEFINVANGEITPAIPAARPQAEIGSVDIIQIPCSPALVTGVKKSLSSMVGQTPPKFWHDNPSAPYTFTPDMMWISTPAFDTYPENSIHAASEYLGQAFNTFQSIQWNPTPKDTTLLLLEGYEMLSRFYGATALGTNLTALCIQTAKKYRLEFGVADLVSAVPIDPDSKTYLKKNSATYYTPIPFPRVEEIMWLLILQGVPGFLPIGDPRCRIVSGPEDLQGHPFQTPMGLNIDLGISLYKTSYPARLAAYAALNGNKRNLFSYPTPDTIPDIVVTGSGGATGEAITIPGSQTATMFGAPILQWLNPDGTYALPVFQDNNSWSDLQASVQQGLCTEQQCFNLVDQGIAVDPAINDLLFLHPDAGVTQAWDASCKNAAYLRLLYLRLKPKV